MKILVADDDATSRIIARSALEKLGHECSVASDGLEAWEVFGARRPDVVITDWIMPGLSGVELCRRIRAQTSGGYTYCILVTSQGAHDQIIEGMGAGADDYLLKPLDTDELRFRLIAADRVTSLHRQLADQQADLERLNGRLGDIARRDSLTGLWNRRALDEDIDRLEVQVNRYGACYCMALFDIDDFKAYNDTYGHLAGDQILQAVASQLKLQARGGDAIYRYGGEEFLCILPEQSIISGIAAAQRMRIGQEELAIPHLGGSSGVLTLSAGVAALDPGDPTSATGVLKQADEALYQAKRLGRNRVEHLPDRAAPPAERQSTNPPTEEHPGHDFGRLPAQRGPGA